MIQVNYLMRHLHDTDVCVAFLHKYLLHSYLIVVLPSMHWAASLQCDLTHSTSFGVKGTSIFCCALSFNTGWPSRQYSSVQLSLLYIGVLSLKQSLSW
jgi:hypothetical protein